MKKFLMALVVAACALGVQAEGDWKTTLGKVKDLSGDTGIAGFARKEAPAYITGSFAEPDRPAKPDFSSRTPSTATATTTRGSTGMAATSTIPGHS